MIVISITDIARQDPHRIPERSKFASFIWAGKSVRRDILTLPKEQGGVGFPDPVGYHEAIHLTRVLDWCTSQKKTWVQTEQATSEIPLEGLAWLPNTVIPKVVKQHPMVGATLRSFKKTFKKVKIAMPMSPMTPIVGNPHLSQV